MSDRNPAKLATWLLSNSTPADQNPLLGDLLEEFRNGRSRAWFWRQTIWILVQRIGLQNSAVWTFGATSAPADYGFWLLNRPLQHLRCLRLAMYVACVVLMVAWQAACFIAAGLALMCLRAWITTNSLANRLVVDASGTAGLWLSRRTRRLV